MKIRRRPAVELGPLLQSRFPICRTGRFAHHEFRLDGVAVMEVEARAADAAQQDFSGGAAHLAEGLTHRRQTWVLIGGGLDIVEADYGNVFWNVQTGFAQGTNGAHRRNVVESEQGGKGLGRGKNFLGGLVSGLRGRRIAFQLHDKTGIDTQAQLVSGAFDVLPADLGIRTEGLALDEGDVAMTKVKQVF